MSELFLLRAKIDGLNIGSGWNFMEGDYLTARPNREHQGSPKDRSLPRWDVITGGGGKLRLWDHEAEFIGAEGDRIMENGIMVFVNRCCACGNLFTQICMILANPMCRDCEGGGLE